MSRFGGRTPKLDADLRVNVDDSEVDAVERKVDQLDGEDVDIDVNVDSSELDQASGRFDTFRQRAQSAFGGIVTGAGIGLAAIGALGTAIVSRTRELLRLSEAAQVNIDDFQELAQTLGFFNVSAEDAADLIREMQLRLGEAQDEAGPAAEALGAVGLRLEDLIGLPVEQQFRIIRDAVSRVEDPTRRLFLAEELLGTAAERAGRLLAASSVEYDAAAERATRIANISETAATNLDGIAQVVGFVWQNTINLAAEALGRLVAPIVALANLIGLLNTEVDKNLEAIDGQIKANRDLIQVLEEENIAAEKILETDKTGQAIIESHIEQRNEQIRLAALRIQTLEEERAALEAVEKSADNNADSAENLTDQLDLYRMAVAAADVETNILTEDQNTLAVSLFNTSVQAQQASANIIATGAAISIARQLADVSGEDPIAALAGIQAIQGAAIENIRGLFTDSAAPGVVDQYRDAILAGADPSGILGLIGVELPGVTGRNGQERTGTNASEDTSDSPSELSTSEQDLLIRARAFLTRSDITARERSVIGGLIDQQNFTQLRRELGFAESRLGDEADEQAEERRLSAQRTVQVVGSTLIVFDGHGNIISTRTIPVDAEDVEIAELTRELLAESKQQTEALKSVDQHLEFTNLDFDPANPVGRQRGRSSFTSPQADTTNDLLRQILRETRRSGDAEFRTEF